ncbi:hypothetical protein PQX77_016571 [Marasmius sp. AFHP31]|nr:hypothetical protein PQX77_016571 [Marasmius sp. AFHP31]
MPATHDGRGTAPSFLVECLIHKLLDVALPEEQTRCVAAKKLISKASSGEILQQRLKLYTNFKNCKAAVENFSREDVERDVSRIAVLNAPAAKRLCDVLRTKRWLLRGRFQGNDMDFGTTAYRRVLEKKSQEVQVLLSATEERLQELYLSHMDASWVLDRNLSSGNVSRFLESCCEYPDVVVKEAYAPSLSTKPPSSNTITDPVEAAVKEKKYAMIIGIWDYIATMCTPPESSFFYERLAIVHAHIARCIISDASLLYAAQKHQTVEDFLRDLDHDIPVLERLMQILSERNVHSVRAAIDDVLRDPEDDSEHITFLGGRLYKDLSSSPWPFRAWGHWAVFFPSSCLCAVQKGFSTATEISLSSKFMQLHGVISRSSHPKVIRANLEILNLCGIYLSPLDPVELRHCIQKRNTTNGQPVWVETHNAISISGSIPIDEPISPLFISACMRHPDLMIKIRRGANDIAANFPEGLWSSRTRLASSCEHLERTPWRTIPPSDRTLDDAQHSLSNGMPLKDCLDFAVLDGSDCDFDHALGKLAKICLNVHGVKDLRGLYDRYIRSYVREGDLSTDENGELTSINCVPEERWLMRMHLLGVVLPTSAEEQRRFERRFCNQL